MKLYVLSNRHRGRGRYQTCDGCGLEVPERRSVATILLRDGEKVVGEVRICAPCAREIARSTEPRP
jgi:hypothetical protein